MPNSNHNIFREAKELLNKKNGHELTEAEVGLIAAATIPLDISPVFNDLTTVEGLEILAHLLEGDE